MIGLGAISDSHRWRYRRRYISVIDTLLFGDNPAQTVSGHGGAVVI